MRRRLRPARSPTLRRTWFGRGIWRRRSPSGRVICPRWSRGPRTRAAVEALGSRHQRARAFAAARL